MRIAMISEHASPLAAPGSPDSGGQNVCVRELAKALAAEGHQVTVHTRRDDPDLPTQVVIAPGVRVHHVPAGPAARVPKDELLPHMPRFARHLRRVWHTEAPDVVHAHFWMSGMAAAWSARPLGVPVVQTFHALGHVKRREQGDEDTSPPSRQQEEAAIAANADRVIASCRDEATELGRIGAPPERMAIVPCGVDVEEFTPDGPVAPRTGRPRIVAIGRLVRRKGLDEVVAAMRDVPGAELVVAGGPDDPAAPDPDLARLRAAAGAAGVGDRVRFTGAVAREQVPALLRSADAVVCAPWYEPFGIVPLESMACGVPVVTSAVGGLADTVVDGVTGLHVAPRRPGEVADRLRRLVADPDLRARLGAAGRRRVLRRYTWPAVAAATAAAYRAAIDSCPGQAPAARATRRAV
jgi:glycosyltransferase involved in cell wall biosynthesis